MQKGQCDKKGPVLKLSVAQRMDADGIRAEDCGVVPWPHETLSVPESPPLANFILSSLFSLFGTRLYTLTTFMTPFSCLFFAPL